MSAQPALSYDALAERVIAEGTLTDPWIDGAPRLSTSALIVEQATQRRMYRAAERVAEVYNELCLIVGDNPHLLDDFFGLTNFQKTMWLASQPFWHGIARADVFVTDEGLSFAELNSDTPTGEAEAVILNRLLHPSYPHLEDPNSGLGARFVAMVESLFERSLVPGMPRTVGIVYPTEFTEDLSLVRLYRTWFEERGFHIVFGSPFNLSAGPDDTTRLFDTPISVMLRHYKTDWWGERSSVWTDEEIPDARPLAAELSLVLTSALEGRLCIVNPFGAVLPQNKRSMAFMWEHIHRFSPGAQEVIRRHIPITSRLEVMHAEQLIAEKDEWVLKSDYGAEGDEVILGKLASDELWRESLRCARKGHWIAQRYFEARTDADGASVNHGVFLVAGEAAGLYARVQKGPTDDHALSAAAFVGSADDTAP